MKYRCDNCGKVCDESEIKTINEPHDCGESSAAESRNVSPCCYDSYTEAMPCAICGEYPEDETEMHGEVCECCLYEGMIGHSMDYIDSLSVEGRMDFYGIKTGYAFHQLEALSAAEREYKQLYADYRHRSRKDFIKDGDLSHFAEWLIARKAAHNA